MPEDLCAENRNISVVMPAYNEESAIEQVVSSFNSYHDVDEVIVCDNNSDDDTASLAEKAGAKVVEEERQGYGYAMQKALGSAEGDIVVSVESDQTYIPSDLPRLLAYIKDFDVVLGDRTDRALIGDSAKMGFPLKYGNLFLAKLVELLFQGPRLNDVGCSYRVFHREALESILKEDVSGADTYSPQILIDTLVKDMNVIQIPVNYRERKGESKLTNSLASSLMIGFVMLKYILVRRITV